LPAFEWRTPLEPWRWLLLGALGLGACSEEGSRDAEAAATSPSLCEAGSSLGGGWEQCQNGMLHRPVSGLCTSLLPRPSPNHNLAPAAESSGATAGDAGSGESAFTPSATVECLRDSDCMAKPYGHCEADVALHCRYGCVSDSDCSAGEVCLCGAVIGECQPASCRTDAECAGTSLCGSYPICYGYGFSCQTPEDECSGDADCNGGSCTRRETAPFGAARSVLEERRRCLDFDCPIIGRPFLIAGAARRAPATVRGDWYPAEGVCRPASVVDDATLRSAVACGWTEQALMEHASVAAFARFTLQLMQLGAPAELVAAASRAMADEIRHARACFELARRHGDADVGPGPLDLTGAHAHVDLASVILDTVREGCIGETVAALEAAEALQHCEDPAARPVLAAIAAEELQHAELAWRFVAWALEGAPASLHAEVRRAFSEASTSTESPEPIGECDRAVARYGLLSEPVRRTLRRRVLAEVVAPCAQAVLARRPLRSTAPSASCA